MYSYDGLYLQEEIKILKVSIFVNPYTEPDEEEEKAKEEEKKKDEDYVMLHFISCFSYIVMDCLHLNFPIVLTCGCIDSG